MVEAKGQESKSKYQNNELGIGEFMLMGAVAYIDLGIKKMIPTARLIDRRIRNLVADTTPYANYAKAKVTEFWEKHVDDGKQFYK